MLTQKLELRPKRSNKRVLIRPYHFTNRTHLRVQPFLNRFTALYAWNGFHAGLSSISKGRLIAGILMPDHYHFIILTHRPSEVRKELGAIQSGLSRSGALESRSAWQRPPRKVDLIHDPQKLANVIRYVFLNPCRKGLIDDPWGWEFSTFHEFTSLKRRLALPPSSRWMSDLGWFDTHFFGPFSPTWNEWSEKMIQWICSDATVRPELRSERDYQRPNFMKLSKEQTQDAVLRIFGIPTRADLLARGTAKDFWARAQLYRLENETSPLTGPKRIDYLQLSEDLRIQPQRLRELHIKTPFTEEESRWIEHYSGAFFHN